MPQCVPQRARRKGPFKNPPLSVCDISSQSQAYFVSVAPRGALCDQRFKPHSLIYRTCPPTPHLNRAFSRCLPAARPRLSAAANGSPAPSFPGVYHVARPAARVCPANARVARLKKPRSRASSCAAGRGRACPRAVATARQSARRIHPPHTRAARAARAARAVYSATTPRPRSEPTPNESVRIPPQSTRPILTPPLPPSLPPSLPPPLSAPPPAHRIPAQKWQRSVS